MKNSEKERWLALARECIIQAGRVPDWLDLVLEKFDDGCPVEARQWAFDFVAKFKDEVAK